LHEGQADADYLRQIQPNSGRVGQLTGQSVPETEVVEQNVEHLPAWLALTQSIKLSVEEMH